MAKSRATARSRTSATAIRSRPTLAFGLPSDPDIFENGAAISQHLTGSAAPYERGRPATDIQSMIHYGATSMATAPQTPQLPVFYKDLIPLNSRDHATRSEDNTSELTSLMRIAYAVIRLKKTNISHTIKVH